MMENQKDIRAIPANFIRGCYSAPRFNWQQITSDAIVLGNTAGTITFPMDNSAFFEPKAIHLFAVDSTAPGTNLRFTVGSITVGGCPQLAFNDADPTEKSKTALLSDVFGYNSGKLLLVKWSIFSGIESKHELKINVFNLNKNTIRIFGCIWGIYSRSLRDYDLSIDNAIYCGWSMAGGAVDVDPDGQNYINIAPTVSPYFEPKAIQFFGIDPENPNVNRRFMIGQAEIGELKQNNVNESKFDIISDVFTRSDEPILVNWENFSSLGLGKELRIPIGNINNIPIRVYSCIWGNCRNTL